MVKGTLFRSLSAAIFLVAVLGGDADADDLLWHAEDGNGRVLATREANLPVNPASVVKVATSLWALEALGPGHRFVTSFGYAGDPTDGNGVLPGNFIVRGGGDPDFHQENVFLVAAALRDLGLRRIAGDVIVGDQFWIGWEHGSAGREGDRGRRGALMAERFRAALVVEEWTPETQAAWRAFAVRHMADPALPPGMQVAGQVRYDPLATADVTLVEHRSRPVVEILRRFNVHSNNDIERFEATLGRPAAMADWLNARWGRDSGGLVAFETTSGLGRNRLTSKQIVRLLSDLTSSLEKHGLGPEAVLPVMNCEPSTLTKLFRRVARERSADVLTGKTGTLTTTDGGVSVLAGYLGRGPDAARFVIVAPKCGRRLWEARGAIETKLEEILGGVQPRPRNPPCPDPSGTSDVGAFVSSVALAG
jgi:D-alanyl-D-alanine carboxypeptidase/D-alanyl-D-alanine-endopeptidase (penicillin-binding protein 4)